jgi:hypothetical protein
MLFLGLKYYPMFVLMGLQLLVLPLQGFTE